MAQASSASGDVKALEKLYQNAEHYFRLMKNSN
ncbi:MAG: DUF4167 domain-containing protein [Desulfobulbia bacterium]